MGGPQSLEDLVDEITDIATEYKNCTREGEPGRRPALSEIRACENEIEKAIEECSSIARGKAENELKRTYGADWNYMSPSVKKRNIDDFVDRDNFIGCVSEKLNIPFEVLKGGSEAGGGGGMSGGGSSSNYSTPYVPHVHDATTEEECEELGGVWTLNTDPMCRDEDMEYCMVEGLLGYVLCPITNTMAGLGDTGYSLIEKRFLQLPGSMFADGDGGAASAWRVFQNIVNIILLIFFIVVIYSQLTGYGLTSYGIKVILPKIIVVAVLMNLSFIMMALAVDVSNIVGNDIKNFMLNIVNAIPDVEAFEGMPTGPKDGWADIAKVVVGGSAIGLAKVGGVGVAFLLLIPVLFFVLVSAIMIFMILIGRQALIIILTAIDPLAFAMLLLPNTKSLFDKWRKTYMALLMVFPIIGFVYGGSALASAIIKYTTVNTEEETLMMIVAQGVLIIPFLVVPYLLKKRFKLYSRDRVCGKQGRS